jgi:hypothetical protein
MREAPIRIYKDRNGKRIVWEDEENLIPWNRGGKFMADPDPTWKILMGFSTLKSFEEYMRGQAKLGKMTRMIRLMREAGK